MAVRLQPTNMTVLLKLREAQLYCGLGAEARAGLAALERGARLLLSADSSSAHL